MVTPSRSYCARCGVSLPSPSADCPYCSVPESRKTTAVGIKDYYFAAAAVGLALSFVGVGFALLSGTQFALIIGACLVTLHIWSYYYASAKARQERPNAAMVALVSPLFIVLFGGSIGSIVISAPLALSPAIAVLLTTFALVIRHVKGRGHTDGEELSKTQLHAGEWVALLAGSALAGYLGLVLYRQIYA